ncbi:MAG: hypothetical protein KBT47_08895 [Armatimonadetes bacterium]|nr:hypothetical protein [Candidatus Hippobium faecium]
MSKNNNKKKGNPIIVWIFDICGILSKICLVAMILSFAYLTAVYFGDSIRNFEKFSEADRAYYSAVINNIIFMFRISVYGVLIFTTAVNFKEYYYSKILCFAGAVFAYGIPYASLLVTEQAEFQSIPYFGQIVSIYSSMGKICLFLGILLFAKDICNDIGAALERLKVSGKNKVKAVKRSKKVGNHCWDTGYCSAELRNVCPAFLTKKSCWKLKMGCCDPTMFLLNTTTEYGRKLLEQNTLGGFGQEISIETCRKCHIFLVHQRRKYKTFLPIIVLAGLSVGYLIYIYCWKIFENAVISADKFARFLLPDSGSITNMETAMDILVGFIVILAVLLTVTLFVQILHYLIFKLKI